MICPYCGQGADVALLTYGLENHVGPVEMDVGIIFCCTKVVLFRANASIRKPLPIELGALIEDDVLYKSLIAARAAMTAKQDYSITTERKV